MLEMDNQLPIGTGILTDTIADDWGLNPVEIAPYRHWRAVEKFVRRRLAIEKDEQATSLDRVWEAPESEWDEKLGDVARARIETITEFELHNAVSTIARGYRQFEQSPELLTWVLPQIVKDAAKTVKNVTAAVEQGMNVLADVETVAKKPPTLVQDWVTGGSQLSHLMQAVEQISQCEIPPLALIADIEKAPEITGVPEVTGGITGFGTRPMFNTTREQLKERQALLKVHEMDSGETSQILVKLVNGEVPYAKLSVAKSWDDLEARAARLHEAVTYRAELNGEERRFYF